MAIEPFTEAEDKTAVDATGNRAVMRAVLLGWLRQNPGLHPTLHVKDSVNCGDSQLFAALLDELVDAGQIQVTFRRAPAQFWDYDQVASRLNAWLEP